MTIKKIYSSYEARSHFAKILNVVEFGNEEIFIIRHDLPVAKLTPLTEEEKKRVKNMLIDLNGEEK